MARYAEKHLTNLLDGVEENARGAVQVRRINGAIPQSWPQKISLTVGSVQVHQDGAVYYDHAPTLVDHLPNDSLAGETFSFTLWDGTHESPGYEAVVQVNAGANASALKAEITRLRDDLTTRGRQSTKPLKAPGVQDLPFGMKARQNKKGRNIILVSDDFTGDLEDWDFRNWTLIVTKKARVERIANCIFGETEPLALFAYLDVHAGGVIELLEWCDFIGPSHFGGAAKAIGAARVKGRGRDINVAEIKMTRRCRFDGLSADAIKALGSNTEGGQFIEHCYFGPTPYITGAPKGADPHADCITVVAAKNGLTIRQCYFEMRPDRANGPRADIETFKVVNAIRNVRNRGKDWEVEFVDISECIIDRARNARSHAMQISGGGQPNFGPTFVRDVWIGHRMSDPGAEYIFPDPVKLELWSNVRDLDTDRLLPRP